MSDFLRMALIVSGVLAIAMGRWQGNARGARFALGLWAVANLGFVLFLFANHVAFPLNLDLMEGTVLQHVRRAAAFEPVYPAPSPAFVPLAYNPLFYVLCAPFTWVFGPTLWVLRLVAILGTGLTGWLLARVVFARTSSRWWTLMAVGLFAAGYQVMDAYLDTAHSDSWLLACLFLGCWCVERRHDAWAALAFVAAFWFKQHGALFATGALLYLVYARGWRRVGPAALVMFVGGPVAYVFLGPWVFGPWFHTFTWEVPRQWSQWDLEFVRRPADFVTTSFPFLFLGALFLIGVARRQGLDVWVWMLPFTVLSAVMGSLDHDSSNNVYIPLTAWSVLLGVLGLHALGRRWGFGRRWGVGEMGLFASFALFSYLPGPVVASPRAGESFEELVVFLGGLHGTVYAPSLGQLQRGFELFPAAHWVALEDMVRGPGRDVRNRPNTRELLAPALEPGGPAYLLTNHPLHQFPCVAFLGDSYVLVEDLGDRFEPLRTLPARWDHGWPRFLYRFGGLPGLSCDTLPWTEAPGTRHRDG